jgi:acyl transferase domain-containing protein/NADPH:quinone reductase-like Zn-dependent oxidoreductase/ubiquinone/menaquinone biosynthesis C-methylase UbiE/acyl carrier protein
MKLNSNGVTTVSANGDQRAQEPVAVIGIGCRFPGDANGPQTYWSILRDGVDALVEVPADRWDLRTYYDPEPGKVGKTNVRYGGFVKDIDKFDANFFGISPREAARMDVQQRMILEVAFEALEDGGQPLEKISGGPVGVFLGMSSFDYALIQTGFRDRNAIDVYTNTGGALSIAANRISYCLNFKGPSAVVDTACSSALTAIHMACQTLWRKECSLALAGGIHILITPGPYIGFNKLNMLSADGRCKAFDANANGFVRSEGAGMVVLKPLSQALADRDPIYALIRATALNQDGRTSGLTVPSQSSQESLVREALHQARLAATDIQFVEAHGTGTLVGDPIEARALGAVLSEGRAEGDCVAIGSVKTNIGHLEAAAGAAGFIKAALALQQRIIPANLNFSEPNPEIDFAALRLRVPTATEPWPDTHGKPALACVNSFGFGGSNAHVILQEPPRIKDSVPEEVPVEVEPPYLVPLSARSPEALKALAGKYAAYLQPGGEGAEVSLRDLCFNTYFRRTHHDHRMAIVTPSRNELVRQLDAFAKGEPVPAAASDRVMPGQKLRMAFVFCGQGAQWWAMGRQLLHSEPVFADMVRRCDDVLDSLGACWSLWQELTADESASRMHETSISQPCIFAVQVGLAALWESWGIQPDAIIGHSVGEVAAAYVAGVFSLDDAVKTIYHRGRCMDFASAAGKMLAVSLGRTEAEEIAATYDGRVSVAAINGPTAITLSGDAEALREIEAALTERNVFCKFLQVQYAFHSAQMDPVRDELLRSLEGIQPRPARIPLVSTVEGDWATGPELGPQYWWRNVRQGVRFADGIDKLLDTDCNLLVEIGPHPVLGSGIAECQQSRGKKGKILASLRRPALKKGDATANGHHAPDRPYHEEEPVQMRRTLAALYALGWAIDWKKLPYSAGKPVRLPTYAWQREHYWHESEESKTTRLGLQGCHSLLGSNNKTPQPSWSTFFDVQRTPWLKDHKVQGCVLVPAAAYIEMALAAAKEIYTTGPYFLEDIRLLKACFLPKGMSRVAQTNYAPHDSSFAIASQGEESNSPWMHHVGGYIRSRQEEPALKPFKPEEIKARALGQVERAEVYEALKKIGLDYGPTFQGIHKLWYGDNEALGEIVVSEEVRAEADAFALHPAVTDACLQVILGTVSRTRSRQDVARGVYLPVEIEEVRVWAKPSGNLWCHARLVEMNRQGLVAQLQVIDETGELVVEVRGLRCQYLGVDGGQAENLDDLLYEFRWQLSPRRQQEEARHSFGHLPPLGELAAEIEGVVEQIAAQGQQERYQGLAQEINRLCCGYVFDALQKLGASFHEGQRFTTQQLADRLEIAEQHRRLFAARYVPMLAEDEILRPLPQEDGTSGQAWEVTQPSSGVDVVTHWKKLLTENPAFFAELMLIRRCGSELAGVLKGDLNPLQIIFPDGNLSAAEHLYSDSPSVRFYNTLAQHAVGRVLAQLPPDRPLRVLEIGAGTGGLTQYVLPRLPADRTEYVFTDLSNHFFIKAGQKFADYPFVRYQKLDIENDPQSQEFAPHSFDIILASQVLHATRDLRTTLTNVRRLLAGDGLLVLLEVVKPARWIDLVFGLTEGWWLFADKELRQDYPLLAFPKWQHLLGNLGFQETVDISRTKSVEGFGSAVILSRSPAISSESAEAAAPAADTETKTPHWLVFTDHGGLSCPAIEALRKRGDICTLVYAGSSFARQAEDHFTVTPGSAEDMSLLLDQLQGSGRLPGGEVPGGMLHFWNLDAPEAANMTTAELEASEKAGVLSIVTLLQAWSKAPAAAARFFLITRGAHALEVGGRLMTLSPAQTLIAGLGRVLYNENPDLRCKVIDLSLTPTPEELSSLVEELAVEDDEDEVALRGQARFVHRFHHGLKETDADAKNGAPLTSAEPPAYRLEVPRFGVLDGLTLRSVERKQPAAGLVEIQVDAAALNFSDVMKALGLYPGLPDGPVPLGIECAGRISAIGEGVTRFQPGDEVVAVAPFAFGSYCLSHEALVAHKPKRITAEEGATLPIAFLTAHYAMNYLGRLEAGEKVLIHSGAGGVGLAAIQLARRAGAEVFATAGSPERREFLKSLGVEHVMDSRSLGFVDQVMELTNGRGVDMVLNSLSGEAIFKGLSCLADYGRFLEIGKRDIYMNSRLGMRPFKKNLSMIAIDLDRAMRERPRVLARLFQEMITGVESGELQPLPHRVFGMSNVVSAFRYMAQAKHTGKVVVSLQGQAVKVAPREVEPIRFQPDATYLITGGLGGFGLVIANWLAEQGARNLVLVGRRGIHNEDSAHAVESLRQAGVNVVVEAADVSREDAVAGVLDRIRDTMPPLRGIVHAAMNLEDRLLINVDADLLDRVLGPRVSGAWHLHRLTLGQPLDFFVCFSSMSSVFGLPSQAPYAASNTFLDALAHYRRSLGLPGLSINWGYLADVGYVARNEKLGERFEGQGLLSFAPREACALLGRLLQQSYPQVGIVRMDWSRWQKLATSTMRVSPRFLPLAREAEKQAQENGPSQEGIHIRKTLLAAAPEHRKEILLGFLRDKVARVLGSTPDKIDLAKPLTDIGVDSLMAVELRNWIEGELRVNLPIAELMQGPSVDRLTDVLLTQLTSDAPAPKRETSTADLLKAVREAKAKAEAHAAPANGEAGHAANGDGSNGVNGSQAAELLGRIDELSDKEVDALLADALEKDTIKE